MMLTNKDLDRMWEDGKRDQARSPKERLDDLIEAIENMQKILDAMQATCRKIEDTLRGK